MDDNKEQKEQEEIKIRKMINDYAAHSHYKLNPDTKTVDRVVKGLVMRKIKFRVRILSLPISYGRCRKRQKDHLPVCLSC